MYTQHTYWYWFVHMYHDVYEAHAVLVFGCIICMYRTYNVYEVHEVLVLVCICMYRYEVRAVLVLVLACTCTNIRYIYTNQYQRCVYFAYIVCASRIYSSLYII